MKKVFSIITITAVIAVVMAACNRSPLTDKAGFNDAVEFEQFQAWKAMNNRLEQNQAFATNNSKTTSRTHRTTTVDNNGTMNTGSTHNAKTAKKKGWSKAAKYSAIGAGTGIVLGAVINKKNRVKGGIIGGVLGGGLGYGIGRSKDKNEGRF